MSATDILTSLGVRDSPEMGTAPESWRTQSVFLMKSSLEATLSHWPENVLGGPLQSCCTDPMTGWFRDGKCRTEAQDQGRHVVCIEATEEFLDFSRKAGNDLSTPMPHVGFPGLKVGDRWCLCAARWQEALVAGLAPPVVLASTEKTALEVISLADLKAHAIDMAS